MDPTTIALLESRIAVLEHVFVGHRPLADGEHVSLRQRLGAVQTRLDAIDKDLPDLTACRSLIDSIAPILTMKRSTLPAVVEKSKELLSHREELVAQLNLLQSLQSHTLPNFEKDADLIAAAKARIDTLDAVLAAINQKAMQQAREVDELLHIYEASVRADGDLQGRTRPRVLTSAVLAVHRCCIYGKRYMRGTPASSRSPTADPADVHHRRTARAAGRVGRRLADHPNHRP